VHRPEASGSERGIVVPNRYNPFHVSYFNHQALLPLLMSSPLQRQWKLARHSLEYGDRTLVMGVLNVTPDSFSDGGQFFDLDQAMGHAERMLEEGADILDIGGESTRPGAAVVPEDEELRRIVPIVRELAKRTDAVISVDTTKAAVAQAAIDEGAEIINDMSGLRYEPRIAEIVAAAGAGLVLMHSRGTMETMHRLDPVTDIFTEVTEALSEAVSVAERHGVSKEAIAIDPGIGFSKSHEQNLQLLAGLSRISDAFPGLPVLVGTSRKRFIGRILGDAGVEERLHGTMATVTAAVLNGANIVRVHDVRAAIQTVQVADAIRMSGQNINQDQGPGKF
jgi:dihydropteroate synthase